MVYIMHFYVDGACRYNGQLYAVGASSAVLKRKWGKICTWDRKLPSDPIPTSQRAELTAIILALENAHQRAEKLLTNPFVKATIFSDSTFAVNAMKKWVWQWRDNDWRIMSGARIVANKDLLERAVELDDLFGKAYGRVEYCWIPRRKNKLADKICKEVLE